MDMVRLTRGQSFQQQQQQQKSASQQNASGDGAAAAGAGAGAGAGAAAGADADADSKGSHDPADLNSTLLLGDSQFGETTGTSLLNMSGLRGFNTPSSSSSHHSHHSHHSNSSNSSFLGRPRTLPVQKPLSILQGSAPEPFVEPLTIGEPIYASPNSLGEAGFLLSVDVSNARHSAISSAYSYSEALGTLFTNFDVGVPFVFRVAKPPPTVHPLHIRATLRYKQMQFMKEPVRRCPLHLSIDSDLHLLRACDQDTVYSVDYHGRASIAVPFTPTMQPLVPVLINTLKDAHVPLVTRHPSSTHGEASRSNPYVCWSMTWFLKFMCYTSCTGGMNRRATEIVFTLEDSQGLIYGAQALDFRTCASPSRDRKQLEKSPPPIPVGSIIPPEVVTAHQGSALADPGTTASTPTRRSAQPVVPSPVVAASPTPAPGLLSSGRKAGAIPVTGVTPRPLVVIPAASSAQTAPTAPAAAIAAPSPALTEAHAAPTTLLRDRSITAIAKRRHADDDDEIFTISIRGRDNFVLVSKIVEGLNALAQRTSAAVASKLERTTTPPVVEDDPSAPPALSALDTLAQAAAGHVRAPDEAAPATHERKRARLADDDTKAGRATEASGESISTWLGSFGLKQYAVNFAKNGYTNTPQILNLCEDDLKSIVRVKAHRVRIAAAIDELADAQAEPTSTPPMSSDGDVTVVRMTIRRTTSSTAK
ncbi:hypothetical protein CAOG_00511 [Capsaspora owczarzaki ATCC 30864]|uniref:SAM domain-containing protein n=1 Tax=Capsaspora owczarzaki (strain ATCC 30864) TaxID=595528 RepID=A0A0D2X0F0_CAPO3|nr:hypothetical protein CAOG_00511 [Capsaspora owczarzaki ATCC 30864]KJE88944.1 hypothetical protein CAOG_000511 [Capsaspora owczarzaki ATCC 30864]|eukprot:XP_004365382.2 hypothetical protein CAOG_00511 [Capsaspora owczarzaki ATCC 30864]